MKPLVQIYSLILEDIPKFSRKNKMFQQKLKTIKQNMDDKEKCEKKIQSLKDKEVEELLFKKYLIVNKNNVQNNNMITKFFD